MSDNPTMPCCPRDTSGLYRVHSYSGVYPDNETWRCPQCRRIYFLPRDEGKILWAAAPRVNGA